MRLLRGILRTLLVGGLVAPVGGPIEAGQIDTGNLSPCIEDEAHLCLNDARFEVQATFTTPGALARPATAAPLVDDTGTFWFFDPDNVELVVKVLDACSFDDRFWVFAGGLTNVEVLIGVRDTATGLLSTYTNPQRTPFQPVQDTDAFSTCDVQPLPPATDSLIESVTANPDTLAPLQLSQLACVVRGDAPGPVTYVWTAPRGIFVGSGAAVTWVAPLTPGPTDITCLAEDAEGTTDSASVTVTVLGPGL